MQVLKSIPKFPKYYRVLATIIKYLSREMSTMNMCMCLPNYIIFRDLDKSLTSIQ